MDYEKKYNEALKWMRELYPGLHGAIKEDAEHFFPELRESEDEMLRKAALEGIEYLERKLGWDAIGDTDILDVKEYLEKQKEQKPAWSEEDETAFGDLMWCIEQARKSAKDENDMGNIWFAENWVKNRLKSLRPQSNQEWSEEDDAMLTGIIERGSSQVPFGEPALREEQMKWLMNMLKFHRPCPSWKPSEEQMKALYEAAQDAAIDREGGNALYELYENLKRL